LGAVDRKSAQDSFPKALNAETVWLARFGDKTWRDHLRKAAQDHKFYATLKPRLDRAEADWLAAQPQQEKPVVLHEAPDDTLQTGESRKLGGAMQIKAPWSDK
jgi:hypothetical protein